MRNNKRERPLRDAVANVSRTISASTSVAQKSFEYLNIQLDGLISEAKLDSLQDQLEQLEEVSELLNWSDKDLATAKSKVLASFEL